MHNDIEIAFCAYRGEAPRVAAVFAGLETDDTSRLADLDDVVAAELAGTGARWTPYYDAALHRIAGRAARLDERDGAYHLRTEVRAALARHLRLCDLLDRAVAVGAFFVGDAWARCRTNAASALLLGIARDTTPLVEPVRHVVLERLRVTGWHCSAPDRRCPSTDRLLDRAYDAACGRIGWDVAMGWRDAWIADHEETWSGYAYGERYFAAVTTISVATRRDSDLQALLDLIERGDPLRAALGNPFDRG